MKTYVTIPQLVKSGIELTEYQKKQIFEAKEMAEKVSQSHPATVLINLSNEDGKEYFERPQVFLELPEEKPYKIEVMLNWNGQYIFARRSSSLPYITMEDETRNDKTADLNKMKVLSAKKIAAQVEAIGATYIELCALSAQREKEVYDFKKSLEGLDVHWWNDDTKGYIKRGGLRYEFTIEPSGNIYQRIKITAYSETLETFLKMSDNKLLG